MFAINAHEELTMTIQLCLANLYVVQIVNIEMENVFVNLDFLWLIIDANNALMVQHSTLLPKDVKIYVKLIKFLVLKDAFVLLVLIELTEFAQDVLSEQFMSPKFKNVSAPKVLN